VFDEGSLFNPQGLETIKKILCLATYWLLILGPVALILASMPQPKRLFLAIPCGIVLALYGDRGIKKWKRLWNVR